MGPPARGNVSTMPAHAWPGRLWAEFLSGRLWRVGAAVGWLMALTGCTTPTKRTTASDGWISAPVPGAVDRSQPAAERARAIPPAERVMWEHAGALASLLAVPGRDQSEHLDGQVARSVHVNELAAAYATVTRSTSFPDGALIVQRHHPLDRDSDARDTVLSQYVMRRTAAGWSFVVLDRDGRVAASDHRLCERCHADAPFEGIFGPARERAPQVPASD